jgi:hypothetical protein
MTTQSCTMINGPSGCHLSSRCSTWRRWRTFIAAACLLYAAQRHIVSYRKSQGTLGVSHQSSDTVRWHEAQGAHVLVLARRALVASNDTQSMAAVHNAQSPSNSHKDLVPLALADWLTFAASAIILFLAAGGGIGGGVVMVPLFILVTGMSYAWQSTMVRNSLLGKQNR